MATKRVHCAYNARDTAKSDEEEKAFLRLDRWDAPLAKSLIKRAWRKHALKAYWLEYTAQPEQHWHRGHEPNQAGVPVASTV